LGAALDRWSSYLRWADEDAAPDSLYEAFEWCTRNRPSEEPPDTVLWGDAQLANAVFDDQGTTAAVLDFELSAIGPAELDLGWFFCLHDMTVARCGEDLPGFADRSGLIAHYEERLGRQLADLEWYEIFGAVCTASILVRMSKLLSAGGIDLQWLARTNPALDYLQSRVS
jgi:aminoglycoside phosphotransferase (APT) family kinase protein